MSSRALTLKDVTWIVKIMYENAELVQRREKFCLALGISMSQLTDITRCKVADSDTQVFLTQILEIWILKSTEPTFEKLIEVMRDEEFISTADAIVKKELQLPPLSSQDVEEISLVPSSGIWFGVPDDVHMFTGRVEYMKELHESIVAQNSTYAVNDMTVITAVCGMGGVGKTSLTIHYAWTFVNKFYVNVVWINSESVSTIANSFKTLARKIGQNTSSELGEVVQGVYEYFRNSKTLIIFDNVESYDDIKSYLPNRAPNVLRPYVLLSSRKRGWHLRTHLIDLDLFTVEESVEFFKVYLNLKSQQELDYAEKISIELQNLPLAIRQAGAYIKVQHRERKTSLVEEMNAYLESLYANLVSNLKFEHWAHTADIYEKTVYSTWTVNMSKLRKQNYLTETIMEFISYLNPENIPVKLLYNIKSRGLWKRIRHSSVEPSQVDSAVKLLSDFSLITNQADVLDTISVHRLLQKVVRDQSQSKYLGSQINWVISCMKRPLRLDNYDDFEDVCLMHSLAVKEHIPPSLFDKKYVQSFIELIVSKQSNSLDQRLELLKDMLREEKYEELLESFEKSRSIYMTKGTALKNNTTDLFVLRFVNIICLEIQDCILSKNYEKILKHCEIIRDSVGGFLVSLHDECLPDYTFLMHTAKDLYKLASRGVNVSLTIERKEVVAIVYRILVTLTWEGFHLYKKCLSLRGPFDNIFLILTFIDMLTELGKGQDIMEVIRHVADFIENNNTTYSRKTFYLGECIYKNSHHENIRHFRDEMLGISLHFYKEYINIPYVQLYRYNSTYDVNSSLVAKCAVGIINCMTELNRSSEIIESLSQVTFTFKEHGLRFSLRQKNELLVLIRRLFTTGMRSASVNIKNDLIRYALSLCNKQYEFEKRLLRFNDALSTVREMIDKYLELDSIDDILSLSSDFQKTISLVSVMPGLCEILLRKGRDSNHKMKYPALITECLKISNEHHQYAAIDSVEKITFSYYIATCEYLLEQNINSLIQNAEYVYGNVVKYDYRVNLDYLKVLAKVAVELRHAGQFDSALKYFDYINYIRKLYYERGDLLLFKRAGWTADIVSLSGVMRDDASFKKANSVLPGLSLTEYDTDHCDSDSDAECE